MHIEDTIVAISTPAGHGGIGIVRLSGPESMNISDRIFRSPKNKKPGYTPSHRILYGHIVIPSSGEVIDEVLLSVMRAPNTYTKEDMVEINCHGGAVPLKRVLELLIEEGARIARPGEFTQRAFLNGRIDLAQAEAVLDVINSLTVQSQKSAVEQLSGRLSEKISAIRERLIELTAFVEAHIDFPEDEIERLSSEDMKKRAEEIRELLTGLIGTARYGIILREGIRTAIVGRPNVGKSSLLNALLEHDRAIVTETPGTTRDVIEEYLNIKGMPVRIIDTAGIRHASDAAEIEGVKRSIETMKNADLVLIVLDGSRPVDDKDIELIERADPKKTIIIINKADLPQKLYPESVMTGGKSVRNVMISAKKGSGIDNLKEMITETALNGTHESHSDIITNTRHLDALEKTATSIDAFLDGVRNNISPEFLSVDLREGLDAIGEILGITTPDEILNKIFSSFCIGK